MKFTILLFALLLLCAFNSFSQQTNPVATNYPGGWLESDSTVSTTWDSVYVGSVANAKAIEILNDGAGSLYVAMGNDTTTSTSSKHKYLTIKTTEKTFIGRIANLKFIRTKAASGTCARRVRRWF